LDKINKTQLDIEKAEERGLVHRDYLSHVLRWNYALKFINYQSTILDIGCGDGFLSQVLYVNKKRPKLYTGIDIRFKAIRKMMNRPANFKKEGYVLDIRQGHFGEGRLDFYDVVTCFEVVEHFEPVYLDHVLEQIRLTLKPEGLLLLSTPNYNGKDKAANHIHEYTYPELITKLLKYFKVEKMIGTFASQKDILSVLTKEERVVFDRIKGFLDSNLLSVVFASNHPEHSRNILYLCRKEVEDES